MIVQPKTKMWVEPTRGKRVPDDRVIPTESDDTRIEAKYAGVVKTLHTSITRAMNTPRGFCLCNETAIAQSRAGI